MKSYSYAFISATLGIAVALIVYSVTGEPISNPVYMLYNRADFLFQFIVMVTIVMVTLRFYWLVIIIFFRKF